MSAFTTVIFGRPGSGKTSIGLALSKHLEARGAETSRVAVLSDYSKIASIFASGKGLGENYLRTADGGFLILNPQIFDSAIVSLAEEIRSKENEFDYILAECARPSYIDTLGAFSECGVHPNAVIYVSAPFKTCLSRNAKRRHLLTEREHYVSEEEMVRTYSTDDIDELAVSLSDCLKIVQNVHSDPEMIAVLGRQLAADLRRAKLAERRTPLPR